MRRQLIRVFWSVLLFCHGIAGGRAGAADAPPAVQTVALPEPGNHFALHAETGTLAVINSARVEVRFYPKAVTDGVTKESIRVALARHPNAVVYKRTKKHDVFAAVCPANREMAIIDGQTLKLVRSIRLQVDAARAAASTNPDDPYVYYWGGGRDGAGPLARVHLDKLEDEGPLQSPQPVQDVVVAPDGKRVYVHPATT